MSYTVHNFVGGEVLYAQQLNEMDAGIKYAQDTADSMNEAVASATTSATQASASAATAATAATAAQTAQTAAENAAQTAAAEVTAQVVGEWLETNIGEISGYVIDDQLTVTNAAADAKIAGDEIRNLKSAIDEICDITGAVQEYVWKQNHYLSNSSGTIDVVNGFVASKDYECVVVPCQSGDVVTITAYAQNINRAWAFVQANGAVMTNYMCAANGGGTDLKLQVPEDAAYLVCNNWYGSAAEATGKAVKTTESEFVHKVTTVNKSLADEDALLVDGHIKYDTGVLASNASSYLATDYINIQGATSITVVVPILGNGSSHAGIAYYNSSKTYTEGVAYRVVKNSSVPFETITITPPDGAVYLRTAFRTAEASSFYITATYDTTIQQITDEIDDIKKAIQRSPLCMGMQMFEKIGVIGDSISCGWANDKNGANSRRNLGISWPQQMARRLGCTAYNLGASGVDPVEWFQTNYEFYQYCYPQYQSVGECNLYIIGLGLNQATLGSVSDINQSDYTQNGATFYGQYARIIQMINADHPDAIVMCLTEPTPSISSYDEAVRDICALNYINAELVDLENDYFDLFNTPEIKAQKQTDNLHYTPYGYSLIANAMMIALNDYISKHTEAFRYVGVANS